MLPLESIHFAGLEKPGDKQFQTRMFVNQEEKAKNSIFDEISKEICGSSNHIQAFTWQTEISTSGKM